MANEYQSTSVAVLSLVTGEVGTATTQVAILSLVDIPAGVASTQAVQMSLVDIPGGTSTTQAVVLTLVDQEPGGYDLTVEDVYIPGLGFGNFGANGGSAAEGANQTTTPIGTSPGDLSGELPPVLAAGEGSPVTDPRSANSWKILNKAIQEIQLRLEAAGAGGGVLSPSIIDANSHRIMNVRYSGTLTSAVPKTVAEAQIELALTGSGSAAGSPEMGNAAGPERGTRSNVFSYVGHLRNLSPEAINEVFADIAARVDTLTKTSGEAKVGSLQNLSGCRIINVAEGVDAWDAIPLWQLRKIPNDL